MFAEIVGQGLQVPKKVIDAHMKLYTLELTHTKYDDTIRERVYAEIEKSMGETTESGKSVSQLLNSVDQHTNKTGS